MSGIQSPLLLSFFPEALTRRPKSLKAWQIPCHVLAPLYPRPMLQCKPAFLLREPPLHVRFLSLAASRSAVDAVDGNTGSKTGRDAMACLNSDVTSFEASLPLRWFAKKHVEYYTRSMRMEPMKNPSSELIFLCLNAIFGYRRKLPRLAR